MILLLWAFLSCVLESTQSERTKEGYEIAGFNDLDIVLNKKGGQWVKALPPPKPGPPPPLLPNSNSSTVVVLLAAFRETRCPDTLMSFFTNASFPDRVSIAVVQQNAEADVDCLEGYCQKMWDHEGKEPGPDPRVCTHSDRVRVLRMKDTEAKGPVFARARQAELVEEPDDFCMQIDAHTLVVQGWDVRMLEEWYKANNEYALLSTYPTNALDLGRNSNSHWEMPHICTANLLGNGLVSNAQANAAAGLTRPLLAPLWAAGLSFGRCHAERNVPNDINLKSVFSGEEYGRGARLWTHGYDFYSMSRPLLGTWYGGQKGIKGHWHSSSQEALVSATRLATLLKWPGSDQSPEAVAALGKYALGKRRTLEQYAEFSGVNTINGTSREACVVEFVHWNDGYESAYAEYPHPGQYPPSPPVTTRQNKEPNRLASPPHPRFTEPPEFGRRRPDSPFESTPEPEEPLTAARLDKAMRLEATAASEQEEKIEAERRVIDLEVARLENQTQAETQSVDWTFWLVLLVVGGGLAWYLERWRRRTVVALKAQHST